MTVTALTHRGVVRPENQDAGGSGRWLLGDGLLATMRLPVDGVVACCVTDGAGGHPAGQRASSRAAAAFLEASARMHDRADVAAAAGAAHDALEQEMQNDPGCRGMGSTLAALQVTPADVFFANVGDSRIYEVLPDGVLQVSVDDHPPRPEFVPADARTSVLTQMLGGTPSGAPPSPHVDRCALEDGLRFLLCSDGLNAVLSDADIGAELRRSADARTAVQQLVTQALIAGAPDNVTVMLVDLRRPASPQGRPPRSA